MLGTAKVRKRASSRARVWSHGNSCSPAICTRRTWSASGSRLRVRASSVRCDMAILEMERAGGQGCYAALTRLHLPLVDRRLGSAAQHHQVAAEGGQALAAGGGDHDIVLD